MEWYLTVLKKYAVFSGRARRTEYWMFSLINFLIAFALVLVESALAGSTILYTIYALAVFIPGLAVSVRRLHDTGRSGWWFLILLVPLIGAIAFIVFMVQDSKEDKNDYGTNPKLAAA
jgi:uncharacterized membrane protein YhaH (DUF805 family)